MKVFAAALMLLIIFVFLIIVHTQYYSSIEIYMDEIFHIPQSQQYCRNNFTHWDNKITTFPGIYYTSYAYVQIYAKLVGVDAVQACGTTTLRFVNVCAASLLPYIYSKCRSKINPQAGDDWIVALILFLYPLSAFYYNMFYTDTLSTLTLVATYGLSCWSTNTHSAEAYKITKRNENVSTQFDIQSNKPFWWSIFQHVTVFMMASCSILMRQTNAVWLLFFAGTNMLGLLKSADQWDHNSGQEVFDSQLRDATLPSVCQLVYFVSQLWRHKSHLLTHSIALLLPVMAFAVFVVKNGGIVLGDKENHRPVAHPAMLTHMLAIYALLSAPFAMSETCQWVFTESKQTGKSYWTVLTQVIYKQFTCGWSGTAWSLLVLSVSAFSLTHGSLSHPFLLADNRHYTFYIWNRILQYPLVRLYLAPLYSLSVLLALQRLARHRGWLWVAIFVLAAAITLLPTPLLEPRYFTPGVAIAFISGPKVSYAARMDCLVLVLTVCALVAVNFVTIYEFLFKPFMWVDGTVARFMY